MCSVWPTIDTLLINHDETLWAVSVHARPPVVSSALLLSSSATVNDDHLPIHFYSLLSLSYFANHPKSPFPSFLAPALRSISIQRVSLIVGRVCSFDARMPQERIKEWQAFWGKQWGKYMYIYFFFQTNGSINVQYDRGKCDNSKCDNKLERYRIIFIKQLPLSRIVEQSGKIRPIRGSKDENTTHVLDWLATG